MWLWAWAPSPNVKPTALGGRGEGSPVLRPLLSPRPGQSPKLLPCGRTRSPLGPQWGDTLHLMQTQTTNTHL